MTHLMGRRHCHTAGRQAGVRTRGKSWARPHIEGSRQGVVAKATPFLSLRPRRSPCGSTRKRMSTHLRALNTHRSVWMAQLREELKTTRKICGERVVDRAVGRRV